MTPEQKHIYYGIALDGVRNLHELPALPCAVRNELIARLINVQGDELVDCFDLRVLYRMALRGLLSPIE